MADYKELLRRAISALPENNGAARRAIYEKARSALVGQLRSKTPMLSAQEITRHRLQLEDSIRDVEQGASEPLITLERRAGPKAMIRTIQPELVTIPTQHVRPAPRMPDQSPVEKSIEKIIAQVGEIQPPPEPAKESAHSAHGGETYVIRPTAFRTPHVAQEIDFASAMMPFSSAFDPVWKAIQRAVSKVGWRSSRADEIWESQIIIEDVFGLIFRSQVVICDFSGKNPNVFYEAGIAHTLGRLVIPIVQDMADLPFDLKHHRTLQYDNTQGGRTKLQKELVKRLTFFQDQQKKP